MTIVLEGWVRIQLTLTRIWGIRGFDMPDVLTLLLLEFDQGRKPLSVVNRGHCLIPHAKCRAILRTGLAPVVEPRGRNIGVAKPFLDFGDIGLM